MIASLRVKLPAGAIALAGAGLLTVAAILGIAGIVMGTQCLLRSTEPGQCGASLDPAVAAPTEPLATAEANTSTVVMTTRPAASSEAPLEAAATPPSGDLIDATFRLLPTEAGLPLAVAKSDTETAETIKQASVDPQAGPLSTTVTPLDFSEPVPSAEQSQAPVPAARMTPIKVAYAAETPVEDTPPPDGSAAAAVTSLAKSDVVKVGQGPLNVRAGPSSSKARIFVLEPGKEIEVLEQSKGWARIADAEGREGWVDASFLANLDRATAAAPPKQTASISPEHAKEPTPDPSGSDKRIVGGSGVNVRSGPSKASAKLFALAAGQEVTVTGEDKGWLQVLDAQGRSGWIYKTFLAAVN